MQIRMSFNSRRRAVPPARLHHSLFYHTYTHTHKTSLGIVLSYGSVFFHLHPSKFPVFLLPMNTTRGVAAQAAPVSSTGSNPNRRYNRSAGFLLRTSSESLDISSRTFRLPRGGASRHLCLARVRSRRRLRRTRLFRHV